MTVPLPIQITVSRQQGSGGSELEQRLAGRARLLKVFVHASQPFRIARMMNFYGAATKTEAEEMIDSTDRDRERFVERFAGVSWYDARNYHLSIDMSLLGFDMAEEIIVSLANRISEGN
jgi:cytidylate kinase